MSTHLLITLDRERRLLADVDFACFLELSQGHCVLIDERLSNWLNVNLPDRHTVITTTEHLLPTYQQLVSEHRDIVVLGYDLAFIKVILPEVDVFHLYHVTEYLAPSSAQRIGLPDLNHWTLLHKDPGCLYPNQTPSAYVRSRYQRIRKECHVHPPEAKLVAIFVIGFLATAVWLWASPAPTGPSCQEYAEAGVLLNATVHAKGGG